jgi:integrase
MNSTLRIITKEKEPENIRKNYINIFNQSEPKRGVLFSDFIEMTINKKSKRMGCSYLKNYKTILYHLNKFSELNNLDVFTNSVNENFLDDFIVYLEEENLRLTYIKNIVTLVKSMVKKAGTYGYVVDSTYDDVILDDEDPFSIYLSLNEITRIYYYMGLTKKQQRIRDLFVVGCLTALRYSDYSTLTKQNFHGNFIIKITKKTNKKVTLPIHDYVREIYEKYNGEISSGLSLQHFNRYIKMIVKKVGLNELITFNYTKGGKLITETKEKWELVSSHTARRSAATNMYLTGRFKIFEIMNFTGHTSEKSFLRYIKITNEDVSKQLSSDLFFRK